MGIIDKVGALLPWRGERGSRRRRAETRSALRDDLDRWLQRLFDEPRDLLPLGRTSAWMPSADVQRDRRRR